LRCSQRTGSDDGHRRNQYDPWGAVPPDWSCRHCRQGECRPHQGCPDELWVQDSRHGNDFIDLRLSYFILNVYGRDEELVEFAAIKQDFPTIILSLINHKKFSDALKYIETFASYGVENINNTFKKLFYNYAALFMKKNPKETISIMENYYKVNKTQEEIIRILMSSDIKSIPNDDEEYNSILTYMKKLMNKPIKTEKIEMNFTKNKNLHNLYILLL
jgi:hypothetical protein